MRRHLRLAAAVLALAGLAVGGALVWRTLRDLDAVVTEKFSGRRWDFPSKILAAATPLYAGHDIRAIHLDDRLARLQYRPDDDLSHPGQFHRNLPGGAIDVFLRSFPSPAGVQPARRIRFELTGLRIARIIDLESGQELTSVELEPELLAGLYQDIWEERQPVTLAELPATLINAILATEDQRFFEHRGIDGAGVLRALMVNLSHGRVVQGGSTLTQQLMKNFFLTEERTLGRKVREAAMALIAERRYSKREILETYLNEIYLGQNGAQGIFGVWQAARFYFHKAPAALSLPECALLAGLIKAPNRYSPFQHPERATERRNAVLRLMRKNGLIAEGDLEDAAAEPLGVFPPGSRRAEASYFVDFVRQELAGTYPAEVLTKDGLGIFTSLDMDMQVAAETAIRNGLQELERRYPHLARGDRRVQACLVAIQPQTGEITAMVGGRDYGSTQFNRVTQALRQPGSVFKPFTYAAALDHAPGSGGVLPTSRLDDEPFTWEYDGRTWSPANYKNAYHGSVTVRQALELSLNAATSRLAERVGLHRIRDTAQRMGITSSLPLVPSMVLGAVEVTPFEVAQAYSVFANQGLRAAPLSVRAVIDHDGRVIERHPMEIQRAIRPEVAYLVTHLLEGVMDHGTGAASRRLGFSPPAAGKTGTTNDNRDAWFVGFTPGLLAVVWVGFDESRALGLTGAQAALPLWTDFMKRAAADQPGGDFVPPPGVTMARIDPLTGGLATPACGHTIDEAFLSGDEPTTPCPLHAGIMAPGTDTGGTRPAGSVQRDRP